MGGGYFFLAIKIVGQVFKKLLSENLTHIGTLNEKRPGQKVS